MDKIPDGTHVEKRKPNVKQKWPQQSRKVSSGGSFTEREREGRKKRSESFVVFHDMRMYINGVRVCVCVRDKRVFRICVYD